MDSISINMKLVSINKNVASFVAVNDATDEDDLSPSGRVNYGQAEFVVSNKEALDKIESGGKLFTFTIAPLTTEPAEEEKA